jgi:hypothetical protein
LSYIGLELCPLKLTLHGHPNSKLHSFTLCRTYTSDWIYVWCPTSIRRQHILINSITKKSELSIIKHIIHKRIIVYMDKIKIRIYKKNNVLPWVWWCCQQQPYGNKIGWIYREVSFTWWFMRIKPNTNLEDKNCKMCLKKNK